MISNIVWLFFSFRGRMSRTAFWIVAVAAFALCTAVAAATMVATFGKEAHPQENYGVPDPQNFGPLGLVAILCLLWCIASSSVKRLHDLGQPAWWLLVWPVFSYAAIRTSFESLAAGPLILWLLLGFIPGRKGANKYGESPAGVLPKRAAPAEEEKAKAA